MCMVNVIIEEYLYILRLHQFSYDKFDVMANVYDGFSCPTIGLISLLIEVGSKCLEITFSIIPTSNMFHVKLEHHWLSSMKVIPYTIHKRFKFPHNGIITTINHSLCKPMMKRGNFTLDYFWPKKLEPLKTWNDILFLCYQK